MDDRNDASQGLVPVLGEEIQHLRRRRKMSRDDLAAAVGISPTTMGRIERDGPVDIGVTSRIAEVLGITLSELTRRAEAEHHDRQEQRMRTIRLVHAGLLKLEMDTTGLTMQTIADVTNVPTSVVAAWLSGRAMPTLEQRTALRRIAPGYDELREEGATAGERFDSRFDLAWLPAGSGKAQSAFYVELKNHLASGRPAPAVVEDPEAVSQ